MDLFFFFNIDNTLVNIPIGGGYAMSWIEAIGTLSGILCIWLVSKEKAINYPLGLFNVSLFAVIFFQIQLYGLLLLQLFFFCANVYGWYAWTRPNSQGEKLTVRWLSMKKLFAITVASTVGIIWLTYNIDPFFLMLANSSVDIMNLFGAELTYPELAPDPFPFWDSLITVLSVVAQILMTRKYVENWILWVAINIVSIVIYALQGVYVISLQYFILLLIALKGTQEWRLTAQKNKSAPFQLARSS